MTTATLKPIALSDAQVRVIGNAFGHMARNEPGFLTAHKAIGKALVGKGLAFWANGDGFYLAGHFGRAPNYKGAIWARERTTRSINKLRAMRGQEVS
jgi:hypothetical protein